MGGVGGQVEADEAFELTPGTGHASQGGSGLDDVLPSLYCHHYSLRCAELLVSFLRSPGAAPVFDVLERNGTGWTAQDIYAVIVRRLEQHHRGPV